MNSPRQLAHALVAITAWLAFVGLWLLLFKQGKLTADALRTSGETVGAIAAAVAVVTLGWVHHNLRIYRRKGPRKGRPLMAARTDVDRLGHEVHWHFRRGHKGARRAGIVVVELHDGEKHYRGGTGR